MSDKRETNPVNGSFLEQVKTLFEAGQKCAILYEDNGVTRANGLITALFEQDGKWRMRLNDTIELNVDSLYAVNGTFSSDYSEC